MAYLATYEGLSGSGKSTAAAGVQKLLAEAGLTSALFHDRTAYPASAEIDRLLHEQDLSPMARMYAIIAARRQVVDRQILPSMETHDITLTDRKYYSTIAYQAYGE